MKIARTKNKIEMHKDINILAPAKRIVDWQHFVSFVGWSNVSDGRHDFPGVVLWVMTHNPGENVTAFIERYIIHPPSTLERRAPAGLNLPQMRETELALRRCHASP